MAINVDSISGTELVLVFIEGMTIYWETLIPSPVDVQRTAAFGVVVIEHRPVKRQQSLNTGRRARNVFRTCFPLFLIMVFHFPT